MSLASSPNCRLPEQPTGVPLPFPHSELLAPPPRVYLREPPGAYLAQYPSAGVRYLRVQFPSKSERNGALKFRLWFPDSFFFAEESSEKTKGGTAPEVLWLRLSASTIGAWVQCLVEETASLVAHTKERKKERNQRDRKWKKSNWCDSAGIKQ